MRSKILNHNTTVCYIVHIFIYEPKFCSIVFIYVRTDLYMKVHTELGRLWLMPVVFLDTIQISDINDY